MKFGKLIRLEANLSWNTKWTDHYINYKTFKQVINRLVEMDSKEMRKLEQVLFDSKNNRKRKVSIVQTVLGKMCVHGTDTLIGVTANNTQLSEGISSANNNNIHRDFRFGFESTRDFRQECFQEIFRREILKIANFCREQIKSISTFIDDVEMMPSEITPETTKVVVNVGRRKRLVQLSLLSRRLEQFIHINFDGLQKIVKKFDKRCGCIQANIENPDFQKLEVQATPILTQKRLHYLTCLKTCSDRIDSMINKFGVATKSEKEEVQEKEKDENLYEDTVPTFTELTLESFPAESVTRMRIVIQNDALGCPITVPVIVAKGAFDGPVLGITSALHGNELNGVPLIFRLIRELDVEFMHGVIVAIPVLNCPGYLRHQRYFHDGQDLNRLFPGNPNGNCGQTYVHQVMQKLIKKFNFHIDLHTASSGRINSLYVRADMNNRVTHSMAMLQESQIIVHNTAPDGSLRSAAMKLGIPCITVEIGDPSRIHRGFVASALLGAENIMASLHMTQRDTEHSDVPSSKPVICSRSFWLFSKHGGLLSVKPDINTWVIEGNIIAQIRNMFGDVIATYRAERDSVVVGKSVDPVCSTGDRIIHLGIVESSFPTYANDGHT